VKTSYFNRKGKLPRTCYFESSDGALFVPTQPMYVVHAQAKRLVAETQGKCSVREIARASWMELQRLSAEQNTGGKQGLRGLITRQVNNWGHLPWFHNWLLRGEMPGDRVTIVSQTQLAKARRAWDFIGHLLEAKLHPDDLSRWIKHGSIPSVQWLKWLYGFPSPSGVFVITPKLRSLRSEMSTYGICRAAKVSHRIFSERKEDGGFAAMIRPEFDASNRRADSLLKERLAKVRKKAQLYECCQRAGFKRTEDYWHLLAEAERLGAKGELTAYLRMIKPFGRGNHNLSGLVSEKLFVPSHAMLEFRRVAMKAMQEENAWKLQTLPSFDAWFADWAAPYRKFGRAPGFRRSPRRAIEEDRGASSTATLVQRAPEVPEPTRSTAELIGQPRETRSKPAKEKHLKWKAWKNDGMSYGQIRDKWESDTGETVSRDTIIKGIKRVGEDASSH